jgi:hypothetical protein
MLVTITHSNGYQSLIEDSLKEGDIITGYNKGFYKITEIQPRADNTPLIHFTLFAREDGTLCKTKNPSIKGCDGAYVRLAKDSIKARIQKSVDEQRNLRYLESLL